MKNTKWIALVVALVAAANDADAQAPVPTPADSALEACVAAAGRDDEKATKQLAEKADALFDAMIASKTRVADALSGKARVISQCRVPFAPLLRKIPLIDDGNELLKRALAIDSMHFGARFTLALNHFHVPEMFGRTDDAIVQLEKLTVIGRGRPIPPMAMVYMFLGDAYMRKGRTDDAIAMWRTGLEAFPSRAADFESRLKKVVGGNGNSNGNGNNNTGRGTATVTGTGTANSPIYDIAPIVVEAGKFSVDDTRGGSASLKRLDVVTMPGGTADVLQVFQAMPGVTRASEGSDLYVRGGDAAEAPVFVDGARMTYAGAFEGLHGGIFGVLDPNAIKKADFSSGGFSAKFGNALSGILDITTESRPNSRGWRAGANLVSIGASAKTPLGEKAGALITGKFTETSALLWTQDRSKEYPKKPWSGNAMAGVSYNPNRNVEIKATALTEVDDATRMIDVMGYHGPMRAQGGTHMGWLSARAVNSAGTVSLRGSVSAAVRSTGFGIGVLDRERDDYSYTLRVDGDIASSNRVRVRAGVEGAAYEARENGFVPTTASLSPGSPARSIADRHDATHAGAYIETEVNATPKFAFIAGLRTDKLPAMDGMSIDPRVALAYRTNGWTLRAGAGLFHQGPWRVGYRAPSGGTPSGVATRAKHFVVGAERETPVLIRVEAFAKLYDQYEALAGTSSITPSAEGPAIDHGQVFGLDALVRWKASGAISGWASYSYLDADVRLRDTNEWIASPVDVRHTLTSVVKIAVGDNWEVGTTTRLGSGIPFTPVVGATNEDGYTQPVYGAIHAERMPTYARFDTRLTRLMPTRRGNYVFYIEGLNLLDRRNVMAYTYDASYTQRVPIESFFANRTLVFGAEAMF